MSDKNNESKDTKGYDDLLNALKNEYTTYQTVMQKVTLDNCLGKWTKDTSELDTLEIPSTSNYQIAQYWYNGASGIATNLGYISRNNNPNGI